MAVLEGTPEFYYRRSLGYEKRIKELETKNKLLTEQLNSFIKTIDLFHECDDEDDDPEDCEICCIREDSANAIK